MTVLRVTVFDVCLDCLQPTVLLAGEGLLASVMPEQSLPSVRSVAV